MSMNYMIHTLHWRVTISVIVEEEDTCCWKLNNIQPHLSNVHIDVTFQLLLKTTTNIQQILKNALLMPLVFYVCLVK